MSVYPMNVDVGRPIRSTDLQRQASREEERFRQAEAAIDETLSRTEMMSLALQAQRPTKPAGLHPGPEHVVYVEAVAGPGGQMVGPFATGKRLNYSQQVEAEDVQGTGALELLRPGAVWAGRSENRTEMFEARLQPARLIRFNELVLPHIAGQVSVDIYNDRGQLTIRGLDSSRVMRYREKQTFNGRIKLQSTSNATDQHGNFIHTFGGLGFFDSDWPERTQIRGRVFAPKTGTLQSATVQLWPTGESAGFGIYVEGNRQEFPIEVQKGDSFEIHASGINGSSAASMLKVSLNIQE